MRDRFRTAGLDTPDLDAKLLAQHAWGLDGAALLAREGEPAGDERVAALDALAARRLRGEPVARILGHQEFYGLDFSLNGATLVPRPETEMLVDRLLAHFGDRTGRLLDLGTGTGCIPIATLVNAPGLSGVAVDLSPEAVAMARENAGAHGLAGRLDIRLGSWFEPVRAEEKFDAVVSNPPYIESAVLDGLAREVRDYDPMLALDGGPDGLLPYRQIVAGAARHLLPGGLLVVEIGFDQAKPVSDLFESAGFSGVKVEKDLAGLDRMVLGHHP